MVGTLGVTAVVSYGVLTYAFAVFITPMGAELGWSKPSITGAYSLAQLIAGGSAILVGRWVDRHGARGVMTCGSIVAAAMLAAWSRVHSLAAFYAIWAVLGIASAAVLYEPAFAVVATWFRRDRGRALTLLTFLGGFASVVFVPLASFLVERVGWRSALVVLAAITAAFTIAPHALVLRRRPADVGLMPDGGPVDAIAPVGGASRPALSADARDVAAVSARDAVRTRSFRWLTAAFALSALTTTAISVHLVPLLLERGYTAGFAGAAMGVLGLMALPGRLVFTPLGGRWSRAAVTATIFAMSAVAIVVLLVGRGPVAVWFFVALFGAGFGAITPARAALVVETFGAASYGEIAGVLSLVLSIARAAAPVGASLLYDATQRSDAAGYNMVLIILAVLAAGSAVAVARVPSRAVVD
jgi:MFS family permease